MNSYLVVGSPNYAAPLLNFQGQQGQTGGNTNQPNNNQPNNNQLTYAQFLQRLFGGGNGQSYQPNGPMALQGSPMMTAQGNPTQAGSIY